MKRADGRWRQSRRECEGGGEGVNLDTDGRFGFLNLLGLPAELCRPCLIGRTVLSGLGRFGRFGLPWLFNGDGINCRLG